MRVRFPVKAEKGVTYENGRPFLDFLVSGTKLDKTAYTDEQGRSVIGERIAPMLLDKMLEQANGAHVAEQQAAGGIYFLESHDSTIPMGWVVGATKEELPDGNWQLHAKVELDADHPLVPVLIKNVESGKYVPDCSVGLKVLKGTAWDEESGGYVGYLYDGYWEHLAGTKPGHPAYPDAELEGVFLAKTFVTAATAVYESVMKDVYAARKSANEAVKGETQMTDPLKVGTGLVAKNKEAEGESEADAEARKKKEAEAGGKEAEAEAGKTKEAEAEAAKEASAEAAAEAARKAKEAEMAAEAAAEAEAARKAGKTKEGEAAAEAGKEAAFPPAKPAVAAPPPAPSAAAPAKPDGPPAPAPGKHLADFMRNIHSTMKAGVDGESSPEDFKALMADIMDDFEEACEMADSMTGGSHEAAKDAGALTITHEGEARKEDESEAEYAERCKAAEADAEAKKEKEELVTKSADRQTRRLLREMTKTVATLVASNKEMSEKLANLDKKPATPGPLRFADATAANLRTRTSASGATSELVEVIKSIEDPQKRDLVSRAVAQDVVIAALATQFPALAEAQKEWDKAHGRA